MVGYSNHSPLTARTLRADWWSTFQSLTTEYMNTRWTMVGHLNHSRGAACTLEWLAINGWTFPITYAPVSMRTQTIDSQTFQSGTHHWAATALEQLTVDGGKPLIHQWVCTLDFGMSNHQPSVIWVRLLTGALAFGNVRWLFKCPYRLIGMSNSSSV